MSQQSSRAVVSTTARQLSDWARPTLRLVQGRRSTAPRAPFVVLVLGLLGAGLIGLLMLSTALQQNAFVLDEMESEMAHLRDRHAELAEQVSERSAPAALAEQARRAGMTPAEEPEVLDLDPGTGIDAGSETGSEEGR